MGYWIGSSVELWAQSGHCLRWYFIRCSQYYVLLGRNKIILIIIIISGPPEVRWQTSRWRNVNSMVSWKMSDPGRDSTWHLRSVTSSGNITAGAAAEKAASLDEQTRGPSDNTSVRAHRDWNFWLFELNRFKVYYWTSKSSWTCNRG